MLQTQMEEYTTCARVCPGSMKLRRQRDCRTRKIQTIFGTISIDAPRISVCRCMNSWGFIDVSLSPLTELLPDRCTPEFRRLQAELSARHSYREAARLLTMLLPCEPPNHARYLANNTGSLINYGERYRSKLPISTSRAEGCVDEIANARMAKKQRMRWSPQGAHRMSTVRAAVLDRRLKVTLDIPLAA